MMRAADAGSQWGQMAAAHVACGSTAADHSVHVWGVLHVHMHAYGGALVAMEVPLLSCECASALAIHVHTVSCDI